MSLAASPLRAGVAEDPAAATAFIRVIGTVRAEVQRAWKEKRESGDLELATGSGFVVSPDGYLLTCRHVVADEAVSLRTPEAEVRATSRTRTIEVLLPGGPGEGPQRFEATVVAEDATLDLALLSISASGLPYVPLGDSDAVEVGATLRALGFPFGRQVDVARRGADESLPAATVSTGAVTALRASDDGRISMLQTDAQMNPGQSGGPVLDAHGYAVGVVEMKLRKAEAIAFATAINVAKEWMTARSLEQFLPTRAMRLGPAETFPGKGLRLRTLEGFQDASVSRLRLEGRGASPEILLATDRVASPSSLESVDALLKSGRALAGFGGTTLEASRPLKLGPRAGMRGALEGESAGGRRRTEFVVADLGREKIIARYSGSPEAIAFNLSLIRASLASLEADALLVSEVRSPQPARLVPVSGSPAPLGAPANWRIESVGPLPCRGLARPDWFFTASPEGDFTVSVKAALWLSPGTPPEQAAAACGPPSPPAVGYVARRPRFDVPFVARGRFVAFAGGLLRLELEAPESKLPFVQDLLTAWLDQPAAAR